MAASRDASNPLAGLKDIQGGGTNLPPVHLWNPPFCGDIDMRIARRWHLVLHEFADWPETAVSRCFHGCCAKTTTSTTSSRQWKNAASRVDDAPFTAIRMMVAGEGRSQVITFETNCDDEVTVDAAHPLRFATEDGTGGLKPYVLVRSQSGGAGGAGVVL